MRLFLKTFVLIYVLLSSVIAAHSAREIFETNRDKVCLISYYQNISSEVRIGSFDKVKRYCIGVLVNPEGLVMVSSEVYPVSLDIISGEGSLLTDLPSDFTVTLSTGENFPAEFISKDDQAQVAFIQIKNLKPGRKLPFAKFSTTHHLSVGDTIFVLELLPENYNFEPLFTQHLINALVASPQKRFLINNYSPALSPGGLVIDSKNHPIGVTIPQSANVSIQSSTNIEDMYKDFLEIAPSEWFSHLIENPKELRKNETISKSWLGIRMQGLNRELQRYWKVPQQGGIIINQVFQESPASKAGLQVGDVILAVNDSVLLVQKDKETVQLRNIIRAHPPGKPLTMKIFRDGTILTIQVVPEAAPKAISLAKKFSLPELGFEIRELTRDVLYDENLPLSTPGVFVYQVDPASPAGLAGLIIGDIIQEINRKPVKSLPQAKANLKNILQQPHPKFMLKILRNRSTRFVFIQLKSEKQKIH